MAPLTSSLLRDLSAPVGQLPWASPAEASRWLDAPARARVAEARRIMRTSWLDPRPHFALARGLAAADPRSVVVAYPCPRRGGLRWLAHTCNGEVTDRPFVNQHLLPQARAYQLESADPYSNRPVNLAGLLAVGCMREVERGVEEVLLKNDVLDQVRMVLYERGRARQMIGLHRAPGDRRFSLTEHAILLSLRPTLRAWMRVADALGISPLGEGALTAALGALDVPALLARRGRVIWANRAGRAKMMGVERWLRADPRPVGFATVTPLAPGGFDLDLVLPAKARAPEVGALPPFLRAVAHGLSEGLADKELADRLGMSITTVRTYVARLFKRMGVHDRRELIARVRASDD